MTAPVRTAAAIPVTGSGTPHAACKVCAIAWLWVMLPMPKEAAVQQTAKHPASKGLPSP